MTSFVTAKYDSSRNQILDPNLNLSPASYFTDSSGNVTGLVGPSGQLLKGVGINQQLPQFSYALSQVKAGVRNAKILCYGDSTTAGAYASGSNWAGGRALSSPNILASSLSPRWSAYIGNTLGDPSQQTSGVFFQSYDPRWVLQSGWGTSAVISIGSGSLNCSTAAKTASFTPAQAFDTVDIYYIQNAGYGSLNVNVDGGATIGAAIAFNGTLSLKKATRTCALGVHTLNLVTVDANQVIVIGVSTYNSNAKGIEVFNAGTGGMTSALGAANTNIWDACYVTGNNGPLGLIQPDLTVINLGINDWGTAVTPATYRTNMSVIIAAAKLYGDVILQCPTPTSSSSTSLATQLGISTVCRQLAAENGVPLVDTNAIFGSYAIAQGQLGYYLPANDLIHPGATGYAAVGNAVAGTLGI